VDLVHLRRLTFELTPTAEAGGVSPDCDDSTFGAGRAYDACRSGSGVERVVRPHRALQAHCACDQLHGPQAACDAYSVGLLFMQSLQEFLEVQGVDRLLG